jgi:hypothetical protein
VASGCESSSRSPLAAGSTRHDEPDKVRPGGAVTTRDSAFFISSSFYVGCWLSNKHDWGVVCNHGDDSKSGDNGVSGVRYTVLIY